jgi:hypothetical protein
MSLVVSGRHIRQINIDNWGCHVNDNEDYYTLKMEAESASETVEGY